jgi:glucuronate isomerase
MSVHPHSFINDNFLLLSPLAERLYHTYAAHQPIIDFHSHLSPADIATNKRFENISQIWLAGDHYKWRAMRTYGIPEKMITGSTYFAQSLVSLDTFRVEKLFWNKSVIERGFRRSNLCPLQ